MSVYSDTKGYCRWQLNIGGGPFFDKGYRSELPVPRPRGFFPGSYKGRCRGRAWPIGANLTVGTLPWRTHSCVPRRDSSRRLAAAQRVGTSADTARKSACATSGAHLVCVLGVKLALMGHARPEALRHNFTPSRYRYPVAGNLGDRVRPAVARRFSCSMLWSGQGGDCPVQDLSGLPHLAHGAVSDQQDFVHSDGCFVAQHGVFRNPQTVERRSQRAQTAENRLVFERRHNPSAQRSGHQNRSRVGDDKTCPSGQQCPHTGPKRSEFAPIPGLSIRTVMGDNLLFRMTFLCHHREFA